MRIGRYEVDAEGFRTLWRMRTTLARLRRGLHRRHEGTPADVARTVLQMNAGPVLSSGGSHFRAMWTADTGKAFAGAVRVLPRDYLEAQVAWLVEATRRARHVPVCVTNRSWHDIPWARADGLPWLLHMVDRVGMGPAHEDALHTAYDAWRAETLDRKTGAVRRDVVGDWMDTVPRPSSTYNNLAALRAHSIAAKWGWPGAAQRRDDHLAWLLRERWRGDRFAEDASSSTSLAADAQVHALCMDEVPRETRAAIAKMLAESPLVAPLPLIGRDTPRSPRELPTLSRLVASYHEVVWTHLGWMYCIGLKKLGLPWREPARGLEAIVEREGTFLETIESDGTTHSSRFLASERDFTMSAGLYLELVS